MDMLIGLLSGIVLFAVLLLVFYMGYKFGNKNQQPPTTKPIQDEQLDEQQRKAKELHEAFSSMMNYDVQTALQRKKV
ncbi:hypothetical protein AB3Z07_05065 [Metabacillus halosaccharovorans]|uniref:hypothetical protein n=1 Tax=Metabacillus halosaccharovorans TaxID=930124 RepID=UPI0034CEC610